MGDIILERNPAQVMKLDENEQALLNEIEIADEPRKFQYKPKGRKKPALQRREEEADMEEDIDAFMNPGKQNENIQSQPPPEFVDHGDMEDDDDDMMGGMGMEEDDGGAGEYNTADQPSKGYSSIEDEKADLLNKLARLSKKGLHVNKSLNAYSSIQDLRTEYKRITYSIDVDQSIKFSRRMLIACVTGLEFLNKRYNPLDVQLEGWSESVMENVDDYDGVFEELYVKYRAKVEMAPEVKLIMMLGGSAMMFHLTNSMFKAAIPNMNDVMKQNPDLMQNMMSAVQNTVTRGGNAPPPSGAPPPPTEPGGRREMSGPGLDISSLMGGLSMPPVPPMNTTPQFTEDTIPEEFDDDDDLSDIVSVTSSVTGDVKKVKVTSKRGKKKGGKSKKEISL